MKFLVDKTNFIAGEVGERYLGNARQEDYNSGCSLLKNFFPLKNGGVIRRPGTRLVTKDLDPRRDYRIVPYRLAEDIIGERGIPGVTVPAAGDTIGLLFSSTKTLVQPRSISAPPPVFEPGLVGGSFISEGEDSESFRLENVVIPSNGNEIGSLGEIALRYEFANLSNDRRGSPVYGGDQRRAAAVGNVAEELARVQVDEIDWVQIGTDLHIAHRRFAGMRVRFLSGLLTSGFNIFNLRVLFNSQITTPMSVPRKRTNIITEGEPAGTVFVSTNSQLVTDDTGFTFPKFNNKDEPSWNKPGVVVGFAKRHVGDPIEVPVPTYNADTDLYGTDDDATPIRISEGELVVPQSQFSFGFKQIAADPRIDMKPSGAPVSEPFFYREIIGPLRETRSVYFELEGTAKLNDSSSLQKRGFLFRGNNAGIGGVFINPKTRMPFTAFDNSGRFDGASAQGFREAEEMRLERFTSPLLAFYAYAGFINLLGPIPVSSFTHYPDFDFEAYFLRGRGAEEGFQVIDAMRIWIDLIIKKGLEPSTDPHPDVSKVVLGPYGVSFSASTKKDDTRSVLSILQKPSLLALTAPYWYVDEWSRGDYPRVAGTYQQRLIYGSSKNAPDSLWFSGLGLTRLDQFVDRHFPQDATGDTSGVDYPGEVNIDDPFSLRIYSNVLDEIRWLSDEEDLAVGMSGSAKIVKGFDDSQLGAGSTKITSLSKYSSSKAKAVRAGEMIYFISADGKKLRSIGYSLQGQKLRAVDVTTRNDVLIKDDEFKQIAYCESRNMLFLLTKAGKLFSYTILENAPIGAWARHELGTGGLETVIQSITVVPNDKDGWDDLWLIVKRGDEVVLEVLGRDYIRQELNTASDKDFTPKEGEPALGGEFDKALAPFYMDSATLLTYLHTPTDSEKQSGKIDEDARLNGVYEAESAVLKGETHALLNAKNLGVLEVVPVKGGGYTLDPPQASRVSLENVPINELVVGYNFESEIETTPVSLVVREGTAQASLARMDTVTFRMNQAMSARVGVRTRTVEGDVSEQALALTNYRKQRLNDGVTRTYSGLELLRVEADQGEDQRVFVKVNGPFPFTLLSVTMRGVVND